MRAYELVEKGWIQEDMALDSEGYEVPPTHHDAIQWCLLGAIDAVYPIDERSIVVARVADRIRGWGLMPRPDLSDDQVLVGWNDEPTRTVDEVIELLKLEEEDNRIGAGGEREADRFYGLLRASRLADRWPLSTSQMLRNMP